MGEIFQWYAVIRLRCESPGRVIPNPRPGASSCCRSVRSGAGGCCPRGRSGRRHASADGGPELDGRKTEVPSAAVTAGRADRQGSTGTRRFWRRRTRRVGSRGDRKVGRNRHVDEVPAGAAGNVAAVFVGPGRGVRQRFAGFEQVANDGPGSRREPRLGKFGRGTMAAAGPRPAAGSSETREPGPQRPERAASRAPELSRTLLFGPSREIVPGSPVRRRGAPGRRERPSGRFSLFRSARAQLAWEQSSII